MATKIVFTKETPNGMIETKEVPTGWSWTVLLFGPIPYFQTGMLAMGAIILLASLFVPLVPSILMSFAANKQRITWLLQKGWEVKDPEQRKELKYKYGINFKEEVAPVAQMQNAA